MGCLDFESRRRGWLSCVRAWRTLRCLIVKIFRVQCMFFVRRGRTSVLDEGRADVQE